MLRRWGILFMELLSSVNDVYGLYNVAYNVVEGPVGNPVIACFSPRHIGGGGQRILYYNS